MNGTFSLIGNPHDDARAPLPSSFSSHTPPPVLCNGNAHPFPPLHHTPTTPTHVQFGHIVLTTTFGIMDHEEARRRFTGGKVLGFFY